MSVTLWAVETSILTFEPDSYSNDWSLANSFMPMRFLLQLTITLSARRPWLPPVVVSVLFTGSLRAGGDQKYR